MNTKDIGEICELKIITRLRELGFPILIPFGDNQRYDLVFEKENVFYRVQVKKGKLLKNNSITFEPCSSYRHRRKVNTRRIYKNEIEYFGVYCFENNKTYLVPISDVENIKTLVTLRLEKTKNNQEKNIRWAKNYDL